MKLPKVITHRNIKPILDAVNREPYFQPNSPITKRPDWIDIPVILEFPCGEIAENGLKTICLFGRERPTPLPLIGNESFIAQGLEGKFQVRKPFFNALIALRDLLPPYRGRILVRGEK